MIRLLFGCHYFQFINGKSEKSKLKSEGEFDEKINKYWDSKNLDA
jgi:hypothetical protein